MLYYLHSDIDECAVSSPCAANFATFNTNCSNTIGSYDCLCDDGFIENNGTCEGKPTCFFYAINAY